MESYQFIPGWAIASGFGLYYNISLILSDACNNQPKYIGSLMALIKLIL